MSDNIALTDEPRQLSDCCASLSKPLIDILVDRLPSQPSMCLSIGCGSGRLENYLLEATTKPLDLYGVEVPTCEVSALPPERVLRVPSTRSVHPAVKDCSAMLFVYPRVPDLVKSCMDEALAGVNLSRVIWLGHRSDWPDYETVLSSAKGTAEVVSGPGIAPYELLVVATFDS
ncbi:hypothetical protein B0A48_13664 [Cryoendolithus antarcticus]|uniref:Methyltransferase domain-containing protein n=1 Tax=Cryoendolithus antarcticus TaxID=1507870 RepID=A0A1V8SP82_9PEZI|nr:hypothetical protein B0A48_13664 [Cryoendolithus antarcticus]